MRDTKYETGSALILAVVLTSLLAIVGVMFVMIARVDKISTSAIAENKTLNLAVETVIAKISQELVLDTPGAVDPNQEYYDYPDVNNPWLASLEPYVNSISGNYEWRQISDVTGFLTYRGFQIWDVNVEPLNLSTTRVVREYPEITLDINGDLVEQSADADGDGIADSKWIELYDITTSKGKPIYAAIRVIDNDGMVNVNTAYKFDPNETSRKRIDGSSQTQINLDGLARLGDTIAEISLARNPISKPLLDYQNEVVWKIEDPCSTYLPFDISDELELRYRYCITSQAQTRLENTWDYTIGWNFVGSKKDEPYAGGTFGTLEQWEKGVTDPYDPNNYRRHLLTTYNMDRIIRPDGGKMFNINTATEANPGLLYDAILAGLGAGVSNPNRLAAQMAVNLIDFHDDNESVTTFNPDGITYYGFERPCTYISELVRSFSFDANDPNIVYQSYAIELYKPYFEDKDPVGWRLVINNGGSETDYPVDWSGTQRFHVIRWIDVNAPIIDVNFAETIDPNSPNPPDKAIRVDPNIILSWPAITGANSYDVYFDTNETNVRDANNSSAEFQVNQTGTSYDPYGPAPAGTLGPNTTYYWRIDGVDANDKVIFTGDVWNFTTYDIAPNSTDYYIGIDYISPIVFDANSIIRMERRVDDANYIVVDSVGGPLPSWLVENVGEAVKSFQRDITLHKCIRRLWNNVSLGSTLGHTNSYSYVDPNNYKIQAHPYLCPRRGFTNVGEIGMVFREDVYKWPWNAATTEEQVRLDLADPNFQQLFRYLTVFDPTSDGIDNDGDGITDVDASNQTPEWKIPGRININTAPWYVIAQLPWMKPQIAQAIVAYRDKLSLLDSTGVLVADYADRTVATGSSKPLREEFGFASIGELTTVTNNTDRNYSMRYYLDGIDQLGFPDLTFIRPFKPGDGAKDDFEERDVIFARISNLVTVRSDVFTAYILVRIGTDGPQKRVIAILDRSNVYSSTDKVKIVAVHPVPDPR